MTSSTANQEAQEWEKCGYNSQSDWDRVTEDELDKAHRQHLPTLDEEPQKPEEDSPQPAEEEPDFGDGESEDVELEEALPEDKETIHPDGRPKPKRVPEPKRAPGLAPRRNLMVLGDKGDTTDAEPATHISANYHAKRSQSGTGSRSRKAAKNQPIRPLSPLRIAEKGPAPKCTAMGVKWDRVSEKEEFLRLTSAHLLVDASSMDGINLHVSAYFYHSEQYPLTHPHQLSSCSLRGNSEVDCRWTCFACTSRDFSPQEGRPCFKTSEQQCFHWWISHSEDHHWSWLEAAKRLEISLDEIVVAVIGQSLSTKPLPTGQPLSKVPYALPSHPRYHDNRIFKAPWSRSLAPATHASEQGLPWKDDFSSPQLAKKPSPQEPPSTAWGWPQTFSNFAQGNNDVLQILIFPHSSIKDYGDARADWHYEQAGENPHSQTLRKTLLAAEEHSFYILLLKLVMTKGAVAGKMPEGLRKDAERLLSIYGPKLLPTFEEKCKALQISSSNGWYHQAVHEHLISVDALTVPVNIWQIPQPAGVSGGIGALTSAMDRLSIGSS